MSKVRLQSRYVCWNCKRKFRVSVELEGVAVLAVECPYCGEDCRVDLALYRSQESSVLQGGAEQEDGLGYRFPENVPTTEPEE